MRRKYRYASREAAEQAEERARLEEHATYRCLVAVLNHDLGANVRCGRYDATLIDLDSPTGGYVLIRFDARDSQGIHISTHYLEDFVRDTRQHYSRIGLTDSDARDLVQLADKIAHAAYQYHDNAKRSAAQVGAA